jgi:signal transduction histidine kinase
VSPDPVDPGSTSALGGALRAHALRLTQLLEPLGEPAPGSRRPPVPETADERALLAATATQLDRVGAALQGLVTSGVERSARRRALDDEAARHELDLDGTRVMERPGPSRVDPQSRLRAREHLQELVNRVAAAQGRDLAVLARELETSLAVLQSVAARARTGAR